MNFGKATMPVRAAEMKPNINKLNVAYLFVLPASVLILLIILIPILVVILLSFTDYNLGATQISFIGVRNFEKIIFDSSFIRSLFNTCIYASIVVSASVLIGLLLAVLVHSAGKLRRLYEVLFFLPVASTLVAMGVVWKFMLHGRIGPVNELISALGFERINFFNDPSIALYSLAAIGIWHMVGYNMILFLAGLTAIPKDLYQAAAIDGADGFWDRLLRITWPMLGPTTVFVTITSTISTLKVFDTVAVITDGGPAGSTDVILYYLFRESFQNFETGYAAALTVVFLFIMMVISGLQILSARGVHYS